MDLNLRSEATLLKPMLLACGNHECAVCGFDFAPVLVIHHILPISEGGTNALDNLTVLCPTCHAMVHKAMQWLRMHLEGSQEPDTIDEFQQYRDWIADAGWRWRNDTDERLWQLARRGKGIGE